MTMQQMTFLIPPYWTATLTLPELLTPDAFSRLESAISDTLGDPRRDLGDHTATDPGSVEFDSWSVHLN